MTEPTNSFLVKSWSDATGSEDENYFPWPDEHETYLVTGDLADKVRAKLGQSEEVFTTEHTMYGGYSEYTQENSYTFTLSCGKSEIEFGSDSYDFYGLSPIGALVKWLETAK